MLELLIGYWKTPGAEPMRLGVNRKGKSPKYSIADDN